MQSRISVSNHPLYGSLRTNRGIPVLSLWSSLFKDTNLSTVYATHITIQPQTTGSYTWLVVIAVQEYFILNHLLSSWPIRPPYNLGLDSTLQLHPLHLHFYNLIWLILSRLPASPLVANHPIKNLLLNHQHALVVKKHHHFHPKTCTPWNPLLPTIDRAPHQEAPFQLLMPWSGLVRFSQGFCWTLNRTNNNIIFTIYEGKSGLHTQLHLDSRAKLFKIVVKLASRIWKSVQACGSGCTVQDVLHKPDECINTDSHL